MWCALHISKRKCAWMLNSGFIKCQNTCKRTRKYTVLKEDLLNYIEDSAKHPDKYVTPYDVFVKDKPDASEWICYDSPTDVVILKESAMLAVLDRVVKEKGLSYTECRFEHVDGKFVKKDERTDADIAV